MDWYVLFVESGKEEVVSKWLDYYFDDYSIHSVVPKKLITERREGRVFSVVRKIFPGYIFVNIEMDIEKYKIIKKIPRIIKVLSTDSYYTKVDHIEMFPILRLLGNSDTIDYSEVYLQSSNVHVRSGPLQGLEAMIRKVDRRKNRAKIQLNFMGEPRIIDVGIQILQSLDESN